MRSNRPIFAFIVGMFLMAPLAGAQSDPYADAVTYTIDKPRTAVMAIEAEIRKANGDQLRAIEQKLIKIVQAPNATPDAKGWACRQLRQVGTEACVEAVAPLLADPKVSLQARWALQSIPAEKAGAALRDAIGKTTGDLRAGVVQSIGARADHAAVSAIGALLAEADPGVVEASLFALGHIGGPDALKALVSAKVSDNLTKERNHAIVVAAEIAAREGKGAEAFAALKEVFEKGGDLAIRTAALRSLAIVDKAKAGPVLAGAIGGNEPTLSMSAVRIAFELGVPEGINAVLGEFEKLPADTQAIALSLANDKAAAGVAVKSLSSANEPVRLAAAAALGRIGDASAVEALLAVAGQAKANDPVGGAARKSLRTMRGNDIEPALVAAAKNPAAAVRIEVISALAGRGAAAQVPLLLALAQDPEKAVRAEAIGALGTVGDSKAGGELLNLLAKASAEDRGAIESALAAIYFRSPAKDQDAAAVAAKLAGAPAELRASLVRVMGKIPCAEALKSLRAALKDSDAGVQDAAVRGIVEWPDVSAVDDILAIAKDTQNQPHKVLALRGLVRLARLEKLPVEQSMKILSQAMQISTRPEEKKLVLAGLADVKSAAAIDLAAPCLLDAVTEVEAASAIVRIARNIRATDPKAADAGVRKVLDTAKSEAARRLAMSPKDLVAALVNIATTGKASSPTNLKTDGQSGPPQAAIDGNLKTYFDQVDNQKLYRLLVTFPKAQGICAISVIGYEHHNYAPKDFEILCDGKVVQKVQNAQYDDNFFAVGFNEVSCTTVELKITGYYGKSPGIRELGIYGKKQ